MSSFPWRKAYCVIALLIITSSSYAQPNWQFTRLEDDGVLVSAEEFPYANSYTAYDFDQAADEVFATIATHASVNDPDSPGTVFGEATSMAQAMNLTPVGGTTFLPTVDTTVSHSDIAIASLPELISTRVPVAFSGSRLNQQGETTAFSDGAFLLEGGLPSGFLQGSLYLVGIVNGSGSGYHGDGFVQARIDEFFVEGAYSDDSGLWEVDVSLPGVSQSFFTSGLNHYFTYTIPITLPRTVNIDATSKTVAYAEASAVPGTSDTAQGQVNLSASAWVAFTPTSAPLPDGDFDGDGDVDGSDFLTWQRGSGESMGATLSQGDANHDGNVDSADLALWEDNYGPMSFSQSFSQNSIASTVPEPVTSAIAMAAMLLSFPRFRLYDCHRAT